MKNRGNLLLVLFFLAVGNLSAQTIGVSLLGAAPKGEFKQNVDRLGYGIQLQGTLTTPSEFEPFTLGLNLSYMIYGDESYRRPFSNTIPDVFVDVDRKNSIANLHLLGVFSPFSGRVRPYAEGLIGGSYIFTQTTIGDDYDYDDYDIASTTNFDDFSFSYGVGGGFLIDLMEGNEFEPGLALDIKARYIFGDEAEYLTENGVQIDQRNGKVRYEVKKSETNYFTFQAGIQLTF